ncbi:putative F-box protein At1g67390 [Lotus japonicus]|uniref:putative F-box protein At1g67390 n=1 Tax=Lotus japonicus TaxID=34305 RepID=UPI00258457D7|nr:putative F-box protein At1g67390 [Lotus japonicus]
MHGKEYLVYTRRDMYKNTRYAWRGMCKNTCLCLERHVQKYSFMPKEAWDKEYVYAWRDMRKRKLSVMEGVDFISGLPDPLRVTIISLLPITECVRTSVLSQQWKTMWKPPSHLSLDQREMEFDYSIYLEVMQEEEAVVAIAEATKFINSVVDAHFAGLKSCRIHHFPEICVSRNVEGWMRKLLEKGVRKISMEMELGRVDYLQKLFPLKSFIPWSIYLDFDAFSNFEELELKNYNLMTSPSDNPPKFFENHDP